MDSIEQRTERQGETPKPIVIAPDFDGIPEAMRNERRWMGWKFEYRPKDKDGKPSRKPWTKVPVSPKTGGNASSTDPKTWGTFDEAKSKYEAGGIDGIGFALGDGWIGVDLDGMAQPNGKVDKFVTGTRDLLNTYGEFSPTMTGLHFIGRGTLPPKGRRKGNVEMYSEGRYFTVTGNRLGGSPSIINECTAPLAELHAEIFKPKSKPAKPSPSNCEHLPHDDEIIQKALAAKNGDKLKRLFAGDTSEHGGDDSAADLALCSILAFYAGPDGAGTVDRIFRGSALCREKWEREDYRSATIDKAIAGCAEFYKWGRNGQVNEFTRKARELVERQQMGIDDGRHGKDAPSSTLDFVFASDVKVRKVEWMWEGRVAIAKLTTLVGEPGIGKGNVLCDMSARVTRGTGWPDGATNGEPADVLIFSSEDCAEDTIVPRLILHGADLTRIRIVKGVGAIDPDTGKHYSRGVRLDIDCNRIREHLKLYPQTRLVTYDPITEYMGKTDSHKNAEVRGTLAPLTALAEEFRVAIVGSTHFNKQAGGAAMYRAMGSLAFVAVSRAAWAFVRDHEDTDRVLFLPLKNNLAKRMPGMAYRIKDVGVVWEDGEVDISADDAMANLADGKKDGSKLDKAIAWLKQRLADGEEAESDGLAQEAKAAGIAFTTYRRAKDEVCISRKGKKWEGGKWFARLQDDHLERLEQDELLGHLEHLTNQEAQGVQEHQEHQEHQEAHLSLL
jgi:hypothetical protein